MRQDQQLKTNSTVLTQNPSFSVVFGACYVALQLNIAINSAHLTTPLGIVTLICQALNAPSMSGHLVYMNTNNMKDT